MGYGSKLLQRRKMRQAGMALDERGDVRVVRPGEKISFPVTWHGAVLSLGCSRTAA
jgi:acetamidase/formamidase